MQINQIDNEIIKASDIVAKVIEVLDKTKINNERTITSVWQKVLMSIDKEGNKTNYGQKLLFHTRLIDLKHSTLLVEVDHPCFAQILNMYKNYIIKGFSIYMKEIKIENIVSRFSGQNCTLS